VADRTACKIQDELGNLPLHCACFSGTVTPVVEALLRAYPKAVLSRNNQGSLPEDITKRLRHANRRPVIALLDLCKEELLAKKKDKHQRSRSTDFLSTSSVVFNGRDGPPSTPQSYGTMNYDFRDATNELEVVYNSDNKELMWI